MLKEKLFFKEELPINVIVANIEEYPIHFHDEMEVVYVLEGSIKLKNGYYNYVLNQGDIFILNDREIHSFDTNGVANMVLLLQIDLKYFSKYYNNLKNCFFVTDMKDAEDESLENLRALLTRIVLETLAEEKDYQHRAIEHTSNLLSCLMNDFQCFAMEEGKFVNESRNKGNKILAERLNRITDYLYDNHSRKLTLNEIAKMEHLSIFYLSHVIKTATGLSFQDLLSFIRVEESEKLLLGTDKKIGVISEESGFSAVRYYIKYFQKWFGMHPTEYREKFTGRVSSREILANYTLEKPDEIISVLKKQMKEIYSAFDRTTKPSVSIVEIDCQKITTKKPPKEKGFTFIPKCRMEVVAKYVDQIIRAARDLSVTKIRVISLPENVSFSAVEKLAAAGIETIICIACNTKDKNDFRYKIREAGILKIRKKFEGRTGISVETVSSEVLEEKTNYMWDSLVMMPYIIAHSLCGKEKLEDFNSIVDDTDELMDIKGKPGILTAGLIKKPAYFAYKMLSDLGNEILLKGPNHVVSISEKRKEGDFGLRILLFHADERVKTMVEGQYPLSEVMEAVYQYKNALEIVLKITGISGTYKIRRYKYTKENSILYFNAKLGFPGNLTSSEEQMCRWGSSPQVDFSTVHVSESLNLQSYLSGFGAEMIMLDKI